MDSLSPMITENSVDAVREMIQKKNRSYPYFANGKTVTRVTTDMDHHPYTRWFRGVYYYPDPIVLEREAGWRPMHNSCYNMVIPHMQAEPGPKHCFETACSTTFPCYPEYLAKYADKDALDVMVNRNCPVEYR